jgi:hypothetical protein
MWKGKNPKNPIMVQRAQDDPSYVTKIHKFFTFFNLCAENQLHSGSLWRRRGNLSSSVGRFFPFSLLLGSLNFYNDYVLLFKIIFNFGNICS